MLRTAKREGYENENEDEEASVEPAVEGNVMKSKEDEKKEKKNPGADENMAKLMDAAMKSIGDPNVESKQVPFENKGQHKLSPSDLSGTDMEQLSNIIDKTTDLIKMLPEGFLSKV